MRVSKCINSSKERKISTENIRERMPTHQMCGKMQNIKSIKKYFLTAPNFFFCELHSCSWFKLRPKTFKQISERYMKSAKCVDILQLQVRNSWLCKMKEFSLNVWICKIRRWVLLPCYLSQKPTCMDSRALCGSPRIGMCSSLPVWYSLFNVTSTSPDFESRIGSEWRGEH